MTVRILQAALLAALLSLAVLATMITTATTVRAAEPVDAAVAARLSAALEQPSMGLEVETVEKSAIPGLYAVQFSKGPVVYATEDARYFVIGDLHEVTDDGFVNVTEQRRDKARLAMLAAVEEEDMIIFSPEGETRARMTVFTDVTCFYCQKLHQEVPELNRLGIEVRYLAYPRSGLDSEGYRKLATAWCADNPQQALTRLKARKAVPEKLCPGNPVAEQFRLGQQAGVRGTPAIVTEQGKLLPGYQPAAELAAILGVY